MKHKLQKPLSKFSPKMLVILVVPLVAFGVYTLFFAKAATTDTASLWMDMDGGSCTYSSNQQLYNSANACADFNTACTKIPTGVTVTVLVKAGAYTSNKTSLSNCKPTGKITFKVATAENASTTSMSVQDTNNVTIDGFYIDITNNGNGAGSYFVCTQNITLKNVEIEGDHSQGTSYGDAVQVWPRDDNTKPLCHNQNFTLDGVYIHDLHTYVPAEDNHTDCVQAASSNGLTIINSRLVNCGTQSFQLNDDAWPCSYTPNCASLSNVKIENSWIGTNGTLGGMTNLSARNNVFINAPNFDANYIKGTKIITGNILDLPQSYHCGVYSGKGVATTVIFSYNIADVDCPAGTNSIKVTNLNTLFVNASTTNADTWDLHLSGNNAAVGAMPYNLAPTTDYDGQTRPQTGNVDIGADQLSVTPPSTAITGDVNGDNSVNISDISALLSAYGQTGSSLPADLDKSGTVNIQDLSIILTNYGKSGSVSSSCVLPKYPTPSCTGVPVGTKFTNTVNGDYEATTPGQLIDKWHITGNLIVKADNIVITNSQIDKTVNNQDIGFEVYHPFTITDSTVGPPNACKNTDPATCQNGTNSTGCIVSPGVGESKYSATRVYVRGHDDGFRISGNGNVTVKDSYFYACYLNATYSPPDGSHSDGVQAVCAIACSVFNIEHTTLDLSGVPATFPLNLNDPLLSTVTAKDNLLLGGGNYLIYNFWHTGPNWIFTNNRLVQGTWGTDTRLIAAITADGTCSHQDWSGNTVVTIDNSYNVTNTIQPAPCQD